ncbi:MAG: hypothetical protein HC888_14090 [Candidatus Competibacteraceae bacterium]|nr:hypothetical protein [Candidatus Competibacteraceae bacterium]
MKAEVVDLSAESVSDWDEAVERSVNGTLFHTRQFLAYHADRFAGRERFVGFRIGGEIVARLSFAVAERDEGRVLLSPYGASYGGIVFSRQPGFHEALAVTDALLDQFRELSVDEAHLAHPIRACQRASLDTAEFALLHRGFRVTIRDVTSVFVRGASQISERGRRSARKAQRAGVTIDWEPDFADFWAVVEATYRKHGVPPTHEPEEFRRLRALVGDQVTTCVAYFEGAPAAALGCFRLTDRVDSAFYICSDPALNKSQSLSLLIKEKLDNMDSRIDFFSFGTSTYDMIPRSNIFEFKENFTKIGMFRDTYTWKKTNENG